MEAKEDEIVYESLAYGWIGACIKLLKAVSLTGVKLVEPDLQYDEDIKRAENEYKFSIQVDFVDSGLEIGSLDLTRIDQDKTLVQVILGSIPDGRLNMYDLRQQNGDIKKRFEEIRKTAPTTIKAVIKAIVDKLSSVDLLEKA